MDYIYRCIIRRIINLLLNRKTLRILIFAFIIWFILHNLGYCDWSYSDSSNLSNASSKLNSIDSRLTTMSTQLNTISGTLNSQSTTLTSINSTCSSISRELTSMSTDVAQIEAYLNTVNTNVQDLKAKCNDIFNKIDDCWDRLGLIYNKLDQIYTAIGDSTNTINDSVTSVDTSINTFSNEVMTENTTEGGTDINDSFNSFNGATSSQDTNVNTLFDFFNDLSDIISSSLTTSVTTINIPIPFTDKNITLKSDIISNIIGGTLIATLLNLCYYTLFGLYIITSVWRILLWFQSGEFINGKFVRTENLLNDMLM